MIINELLTAKLNVDLLMVSMRGINRSTFSLAVACVSVIIACASVRSMCEC